MSNFCETKVSTAPAMLPTPLPDDDPPKIETTVSTHLLDALQELRVTHAFGVPGGALDPFMFALSNSPILPVLAKHEAGGAYMADGYARIGRTLGVCFSIPGPGATNALTGVAGADIEHVPLLFVVGGTPDASAGGGPLQDSSSLGLDIQRMFEPATSFSATVHHSGSAAEIIRRALRSAERGGAACLHVPIDLQNKPLPSSTVPYRSARAAGRTPAASEILAFASRLRQFRSPVIFAGSDVDREHAQDMLQAFAERFGLPVATTPHAKGVFREDHELSAGLYGAFGTSPQAQAMFDDPDFDAVIAIGTSLGEMDTMSAHPRLWRDREVLLIHADPDIVDRHRTGAEIVAGIANALRGLLDAEALIDWRPTARARLRALKHRVPRVLEPELMARDSSPVVPHRMMQALQRVLPEDAHVFIDSGNCTSWVMHYFQVRTPGHFHISLNLGAMGWSIGAAVGGQFATDRHRCVAICGDGAFLMGGNEAHTAVDHDLPIVVIVLNDGGLAMVTQMERLMHGTDRMPHRYRNHVDFSMMAQAMGLAGWRAETPAQLEAALEAALAQRRPALIDVAIDASYVPPTLAARIESLGQGMRK